MILTIIEILLWFLAGVGTARIMKRLYSINRGDALIVIIFWPAIILAAAIVEDI